MIPLVPVIAVLMGAAVTLSLWVLVQSLVVLGAIPAVWAAYKGDWKTAAILAAITVTAVAIVMVVM